MKKAMILAAGRGERMRPLTDETPKPMLEVGGKPLIVWQIEKLVRAGFNEIVINIAHLGEQIKERLEDGSRWGVKIIYSDEREEGALESAGGIIKALPLLGEEPFLVVNADVWSDYEYDSSFSLGEKLAHLVLIPNPEHNLKGDFGIENACLNNNADNRLTFAGIGYYSPRVFASLPYTKAALAPILREVIDQKLVSGEVHQGEWVDVGTPERLTALDQKVKSLSDHL